MSIIYTDIAKTANKCHNYPMDTIPYSLIITTTADKNTAKTIAKVLIEKRLAACVQMFPIESMYPWKGNICDEIEIILFIKTNSYFFERVKKAIKEIHNYEVPEIIQIPITNGLPEYLKWIDNCLENITNRMK